MIGGCKNYTSCTEEPTIWVEDINCNAQNLSESDMDACKIANVIIFLYLNIAVHLCISYLSFISFSTTTT